VCFELVAVRVDIVDLKFSHPVTGNSQPETLKKALLADRAVLGDVNFIGAYLTHGYVRFKVNSQISNDSSALRSV
jgi:hypothetical protein